MNLKINGFNLSYYVYILDVALWSYHRLKTGCQKSGVRTLPTPLYNKIRVGLPSEPMWVGPEPIAKTYAFRE